MFERLWVGTALSADWMRPYAQPQYSPRVRSQVGRENAPSLRTLMLLNQRIDGDDAQSAVRMINDRVP